jgi:glucan phosphoethanolaminetransferase (alkaline phosphatase superfamily)
MAEFFRKRIVALKRRPSNIPLFFLVVAFLIYSLNTAFVSDTSLKLYGDNMGLAGFVTMLTSILIFVVYLNAFPKRQKPKVALLVLFFVMLAIIIVADIYYGNTVTKMLSIIDERDPANTFRDSFPYILKSQFLVYLHAGAVAFVGILVAMLPVYSKLLRKIKTSIDVEENSQITDIDISGE